MSIQQVLHTKIKTEHFPRASAKGYKPASCCIIINHLYSEDGQGMDKIFKRINNYTRKMRKLCIEIDETEVHDYERLRDILGNILKELSLDNHQLQCLSFYLRDVRVAFSKLLLRAFGSGNKKHLKKLLVQSKNRTESIRDSLLKFCSRLIRRSYNIVDLSIILESRLQKAHTYKKLCIQSATVLMSQISNQFLRAIWVGVRKAGGLEKLDLNISQNSKLSDIGFYCLARLLEKELDLRSLALNLSGLNMTSKGTFYFQDRCSSLKKLQHFCINLNDCEKIDEEGLIYIVKLIVEFKFLQTLEIYYNKYITDLVFETLMKALPQLEDLTSLLLSLPYSRYLSDDGLTFLAPCELPKLESFSLNLSESRRISDRGIEYLSKSFARHPIKFLTLDLSVISALSDVSMQYLKDGISEVKGLEYLKIDLHFPAIQGFKVSSLTEDGVGVLFEGIAKVKTLKTLILDLHQYLNCNFSDNVIYYLKEKIRELEELKRFELNLSQY